MVAGVERSSLMIRMKSIVTEIVDKAAVTGQLNIIITDILDQGQEARDKVERMLRSARMKDEHIMKVMLADIARDDRLEDRAKKRLAWLDRLHRIEAEADDQRDGHADYC